jgi:penicillin-binding protein 1A
MSRYRKKNKTSRKSRLGLKIFLSVIAALTLASILVLVAVGGFAFSAATLVVGFVGELPKLEEFPATQGALTSKIFAADGTLIATLHGEENRDLVSLEQLPKNLVNAVISIEDERFYKHTGVDLEGIARAFLINLQAGQIEEGASTITQQVITSIYLPQSKTIVTYDRKIKEAALAYQLEKIYTKNEILEMYLNTIYLGEGAYGVQAAAKVYFNKKVEYLNVSECATIAGLIQAPDYLSPYKNKKGALGRRNIVLGKMLELGYIDNNDYENALGQQIITQRPFEEEQSNFAPYFVEYVKQLLITKYGVNKLFTGGYNIYTTLEPEMQVAAEDSIKQVLFDPEDPSAALVAMEPQTGYIRAMVGGKDFGNLKFNLATQAKRQPGSTFKVFALIAALEQGISPYMTFNPNGAIMYDIVGSEPWLISNYSGESYETNEMTVLDATVSSVNDVYAQLIMKIGGYIVSKVANDMGIETPLEGFPAIGLGGLTTGVSPLEVCTAFATIADYGVRHQPIAILKVTDKDGTVIDEFAPEGKQTISAITAYRAIEIMKQVVQRGTGTRSRLADRPSAGKTGTTQEAENAWFTGFTTNLVACVWMGYPEMNKKMDVLHDMRVQGGAHPAMIWKLFMERATINLPIEDFVKPADDKIVVQVTTNPETGEVMVPNRFTPAEQISTIEVRYGNEPRTQAPIMPEFMPLLPNVTNLPMADANNILFQAGYTHVEFIKEKFDGVPPGYTHRQDPLWDLPIERIRVIKIWYNP